MNDTPHQTASEHQQHPPGTVLHHDIRRGVDQARRRRRTVFARCRDALRIRRDGIGDGAAAQGGRRRLIFCGIWGEVFNPFICVLNVMMLRWIALAPTSQPIRSSPQEEKAPSPVVEEEERDEIDELDNEPEIERPRLSLPLQEVEEQEEEEGSPDIPPPRISLAFDEEDVTQTSIEYPRRDLAARDRERLSMMGFGGPRPSENFADVTRLGSESEGGDDTGIVGVEGEDTVISQGAFDRG